MSANAGGQATPAISKKQKKTGFHWVAWSAPYCAFINLFKGERAVRMRNKVIELTENDRTFLGITPVENLPVGFLTEIRCRRLGITQSAFDTMRNFDQARELADERTIIGLPDTEYWAPIRIDDQEIDAIAKRESLQRARDFEEFRAAQKVMR